MYNSIGFTNCESFAFQLPVSCNWQSLRDKFREMGEVKHAEMRGHDTGIVRFADDKDAELAISELSDPSEDALLMNCRLIVPRSSSFAEIMDGGRFDNQTVYVSFF